MKEIAPDAEWKNLQESAALDSLQDMHFYTESISDLKCIMVKNDSSVPFVTSDDPVVLINKFYHLKVEKNSGTGLHQSGLIMLFPLSAEYLCVLYDKDVYDLRKVKSGVLYVRHDKEIEEFNQLQYINSLSCVYFPNNAIIENMTSSFSKAKLNRKVDRVEISFGREVNGVTSSNERVFAMEPIIGDLPKESGFIYSKSISIEPFS